MEDGVPSRPSTTSDQLPLEVLLLTDNTVGTWQTCVDCGVCEGPAGLGLAQGIE